VEETIGVVDDRFREEEEEVFSFFTLGLLEEVFFVVLEELEEVDLVGR